MDEEYEQNVKMIEDMGFTQEDAKKAIALSNGDIGQALSLLGCY